MGFKDQDLCNYLAAEKDLKKFCFKLTGNMDKAEDLAQETMVRAWEKAAQFRSGTNMRGWLCTIAKNQHITHFRKEKRAVSACDGDIELAIERLGIYSPPAAEDALLLKETLANLYSLPDNQAESLTLLADGYTYEEAGELLGAPAGTIKSRVSRMRRLLADRSSEDGCADGKRAVAVRGVKAPVPS